MMLPRDVNGVALQTALRRLGREIVRQHGSHMRVTTQIDGEHHEVIRWHDPIKTMWPSINLESVVMHPRMSVDAPRGMLDQ